MCVLVVVIKRGPTLSSPVTASEEFWLSGFFQNSILVSPHEARVEKPHVGRVLPSAVYSGLSSSSFCFL